MLMRGRDLYVCMGIPTASSCYKLTFHALFMPVRLLPSV